MAKKQIKKEEEPTGKLKPDVAKSKEKARKDREYYYDDAYGYEVFEPDDEDKETSVSE